MGKMKHAQILSLDIGGSTIKAIVIDEDGKVIEDFKKVKTPNPATPMALIEAIDKLTEDFDDFEFVSAGFPGYIKKGIVYTAPNLGSDHWRSINLQALLSNHFKKPARVVNDADLHGLGVVKEDGLELVITLGTGFGSALFFDGRLLPHLELAHHPVTRKYTYDQYVGKAAFKDIGKDKWNIRVQTVLAILKTVFNYDHLFIGGGNADELNFSPGDNVTIIENKDGIVGGARLWKLDKNLFC